MCAVEGFVVAGRSLVSVAVHLHRPVCVASAFKPVQTSTDATGTSGVALLLTSQAFSL